MDPNHGIGYFFHRIRRAAALASITFVIATFLAPISFGVQAGAGDLGGFENDGNMIVDTAPNLDWGSAFPALVTIVDDTVDSGFQGSSKELKPSEWVCNAGGASPGKGNLLRAYLNSTVVDDTEVFLNLAWVRESAGGQGDVHVNYEFNQNGSPVAAPTSGPCPIERTEGDILVTYDFDGGGSLPHVNVYSWMPSAVPTSDADGDWVNGNIPASAVRAAVNATAVVDPLHGNSTIGALRFGEATINLTAVLAASGINDCQVFGAANIRSRSSGESWVSALQDNLPGMPINVSTCPVTPELNTTATLEVMEGNAIGDVAHLSGGKDPTGTITFRAYGPNDVDCSGTPAFVSAPVTVNGNGDYVSSSFDDPAPGTYRWIASYTSADKRNLDVSGACNDPGETTTVLPEEPMIGLDKKVNGADHAAPADILTVYVGDPLHYTVDITNGGNVPLVISDLVDSLNIGFEADCDQGHGSILSVGAGFSCDYTTTASSFAHNVASVTGTTPVGKTVNASDGTFVDTIDPSIEIVKTGVSMAHEGDAVTYVFEVTNTGDVTLTGVSVDDDVLGHIGEIASLAPGASETLTKAATAPSTDVRNVGTACGTDPLTAEVCDDDDHTLDVIHAAIDVTKSGPAKAHEGDEVTYSFEVTNNGDVALAPVTVVDDVLGAIDTIASLGVGETQTLEASYSVPASTDEVINEVTACGISPVAARELCDTDLHVLDVIHPAVTLDKQLAGADHATPEDALQAHEGEALGYTLLITNTGDTPLEVTAFEDSLGIDLDQACSARVGDVLAAGDVITCTYTQASAGDVHNVASVTGVDELGGTVSASDETFADVVHPAIEVVKAGPAQVHEGDTATYTFQVTNTGDVTLTDVTVSDDVLGAIGTVDLLDAGASQTLTGDFVIPAGVGVVTNVATACGVDPVKLEVCADDTHTAVVITPSIEVAKTANPLTATPGQEITYTYEVTNTGDTPLVDLTLVDDILGDIGAIDVLEPGATEIFTVTMLVEADSPRTNVATVCGADALGLEVCDDDDATITIVLLEGPTPRLPRTGLSLMIWLAASTALMAAGLVMIDAQRQRRRS